MRRSALLFALVTAAAPAAAQSVPLAPGTLVRVTDRAVGLESARGTVAAVEGDTLQVRLREAGDVRLSLAGLERLEVRRRAAPGAGRLAVGALAGAAAGAAGGAILGYTTDPGDEECRSCEAGLGAMLGAAGGAVLGLAVAAVLPAYRWRPVPLR